MPGAFDESDSTPTSSKGSDSPKSSLHLVKRKQSLTADPAIRPIGSEQALPRKLSTASRPRVATSLPSDNGHSPGPHNRGLLPDSLRQLHKAGHVTLPSPADKGPLREIEPRPESLHSDESPLTVMPFRQPTELSPRAKRPISSQKPVQRAITGLEGLMQEAMHVAKDAADHGQSHEVAQVLEDAT
ncbi:hypothetical protein LTS18_012988, partial [Coniosporium uncinatum]